MKKADIPYYNDPTDFENGYNKYPCDTQFMEYNPLLHKYFLTEQALNYYGINAERRYISDNPNKVRELIELTTDKIYNTIAYLSGWKNFEVQMYRIARSQTKPIQDKYFFRKEFEKILVEQARFIVDNGNALKYSTANLENPRQNTLPPEQTYRDLQDISQEALRKLEYLGLTRWFNLLQFNRLNDSEY